MVTKNNKTNKTNIDFIPDNKVIQISEIADKFFGMFIPYLLVLVFNIIVILRMRRPKRELTREEEDGTRNIMKEFTVSTISVDFIFLIFKAPDAFIHFFYFFFSVYPGFDFEFRLTMEIFIDLSNSYSDLLVFIFFFLESSFRKEIIKIFKVLRCFFLKLFRSSSIRQF